MRDMGFYRSGMEIGKRKQEGLRKEAIEAIARETRDFKQLQKELKTEKKRLKIK